MQTKNILVSTSVAVATLSMPMQANAQAVLTGDTRLACEAILCLATGTRPVECIPSLQRYFDISFRRWSSTVRGRIDFLNLCPVSNQTPQMTALVQAMGNGAGRCDVAALNSSLRMWGGNGNNTVYISNQMPGYCSTYVNNSYTDFTSTMPRYVGTPQQGGYWVEARNFSRALATYNAQIARAQNNNWWN